MIDLFSDKIEEVLEKHNVVVSDLDKLKKDLARIFFESQIEIKKIKKAEIPKKLKDYMLSKNFDEESTINFFKNYLDWLKTEDGNKWHCSTLNITKDILTSDFAAEYKKKDGKKIPLNTKRLIIYHRNK